MLLKQPNWFIYVAKETSSQNIVSKVRFISCKKTTSL